MKQFTVLVVIYEVHRGTVVFGVEVANGALHVVDVTIDNDGVALRCLIHSLIHGGVVVLDAVGAGVAVGVGYDEFVVEECHLVLPFLVCRFLIWCNYNIHYLVVFMGVNSDFIEHT